MKVIIEFDLPEDGDSYEIVHRADEMHSSLYDIYNYCRDKIKHDDKLSEESEKHLESIMEIVGESLYWG